MRLSMNNVMDLGGNMGIGLFDKPIHINTYAHKSEEWKLCCYDGGIRLGI
jgi:hypothetical protein